VFILLSSIFLQNKFLHFFPLLSGKIFSNHLNILIPLTFVNITPLQGFFSLFCQYFYKYLGGAAALKSCRAAKYL